MAKTKAQKESLIAQYKDAISNCDAFFIVRPDRLTANETVQIKLAMRESGSKFHVIKNNLFKIALEQSDLPNYEELEDGANAIVFSGERFVETIKSLNKFADGMQDKLQIASGFLDGQKLDPAGVKEIADMPSYEAIMAQIAGLLTEPARGIATALTDSARGIATAIDQAAQANKFSN